MAILVADLKSNRIESIDNDTGLVALPLALELYSRYDEEAIVLATPPKAVASEEGVSSWTMVYYSGLVEHMDWSYCTLSHGAALASMDVEALVITGRDERMKYLSLYPGEMEVLPCEHMRAGRSASFAEIAARAPSDLTISTGPAADKGVVFGSLQYKGRNLPFPGAGSAFHRHNLKGIILKGSTENKKVEEKKDKSRFFRRMKECGEYNYIDSALTLGWLPVRGYSDRFDPRAANLDGKALTEKYGSYPSPCGTCSYACRRRRMDGSPLPTREAIFALATNLGFFSPEKASMLYDVCMQEGLEVGVAGALLSHLSSLKDEERKLYGLGEKTEAEYCAFLHRLATGSVFPEGLRGLPAAIQSHDHRPIPTDLRGDFGGAINSSLSFPLPVDVLLLLPSRTPDYRAAATVTLYSNVQTLGLLALGYAPCRRLLGHWSRFPRLVFRSRFLSLLVASLFSLPRVKGRDILEKGYCLYERLDSGWHSIPSHFTLNPESDYDSQTVPMRRLMEAYDNERVRLEISLKSRSEKSPREEDVNNPKVGPEEDLGRDTDPGLNR